MNNTIRINKYLSQCGLGSRRKVEEYILNGQIKLNGRVVNSLSISIDPENDEVMFNNKVLTTHKRKYYIILNKPKGIVTTVNDEHGRPTVMDLIPERYSAAMVVPVGRLDMNSEGLLLMTNDGEMAYKLMHPAFGVKKEYIVEIDKPLREEDRLKMEKGIFLYGEKTKPAEVELLNSSGKLIKMIITEGKKRHIRLTFDKFSYKVKRLKRISFGPVKLGKLYTGTYRLLKDDEINKLQKIVGNK